MPRPDKKYLKLITDAVAVCADYRPKFGQGRQAGLTLAEFQMVHTEEIYAALMRAHGFEEVRIKNIRKRNSKKELFEFVVSGTFCP